MADDLPASEAAPTPAAAPVASRRTTRVLLIAAGALVLALAVLVTLPGRGTPTVVARATPSAGRTAGTTASSPPTDGPTGAVTRSPTWTPSGVTGTTDTTPAAAGTTTIRPPAGGTAGPTTRPGLPGRPTAYRPHPSTASTPAPRHTSSTSTSSTSKPPPPSTSTARVSPLPGFAFGDRVTLLDPAVVDRRVVATGTKAAMRTVSTAASLAQRQASSWVVRDGLSGTGCLSLEAVSAPGSYLLTSNGRLRVAAGSGSSFAAAATFCVRSPALDGSWGVSLSPWTQSSASLTRQADGSVAVWPSGLSPQAQTFALWTAPA